VRDAGLSKGAVHRWVAAGRLHGLHLGVYAVGHASLTAYGRYMAAVLACGPDAALSHRSAVALSDLRASRGLIEVTSPRQLGPRPGLLIHRSRTLRPEDRTVLHGIPVTTVARTLLDLAAVVPARELASALDRAERLDLFDLSEIHATLSRARGRRGAAALRRAIAEWEPRRTRSELEDRFRELLADSGLASPRTNVLVDGASRTHEVDVYWPARQLVVELDGFAFHRTRGDRERDAARDADLELAGQRVVRFTWDDVSKHQDRTLRRLSNLVE
jgi:very-short-patch-repair endonuclease